MTYTSGGWASPEEQQQADERAARSKTKIIDRRSSTAIAASDNSRRAQRKSVKRKIAAARYAAFLLARLIVAIELTNREKMRFSDQHYATCAPCHGEIEVIDKSQSELILDGLEPDAKLADRRDELKATIEDANQTLQTLIENADKKLARLEAQRIELSRAAHWQQFEGELLALADPELLKKMRHLDRGGHSCDGETAQSVYQKIIEE